MGLSEPGQGTGAALRLDDAKRLDLKLILNPPVQVSGTRQQRRAIAAHGRFELGKELW